MKNWKLLSDSEMQVWDFIYNKLDFKPTMDKENLIILPAPSQCFDISQFYNEGFNEYLYDDLHKSSMSWFETISEGKRIYALNWQHDCYSFTTKLPFEKNEFGEWLISIFPNGDYIFFLSSDLNNGVFADGINCRLSFFGKTMMKAIKLNVAKIVVKSKACH
ncbi:MAG: DUF2716 domain-containing protein [Chitinophagaceae bacterium]|nr:DUF2716 domain-containing protein [Chitinophagaceae bacterium]